LIVYSIRSGAPADRGCGEVARVARGLNERPWAVAPAVRLGMVPAGYPEVFSADRMQAWCHAGAKGVVSDSCVWLQAGPSSGPPPADSTSVTVRSTTIRVSGAFSISLPSARDDPSLADLTDTDLVKIAESATVPGY
jgi:hypothetical protein